MKSDETLNYAMAGENNARAELEKQQKLLAEKNTELAGIEKQKAELGADNNVELKYREIETRSNVFSRWTSTKTNTSDRGC